MSEGEDSLLASWQPHADCKARIERLEKAWETLRLWLDQEILREGALGGSTATMVYVRAKMDKIAREALEEGPK